MPTSTAISAQGSTFSIEGTPGSALTITGITKAEFDSLWSSGESAVKGCFEKALKKQADLEGKELTVSVDVSDKAKVGEIALSGADLDDKAKKCIQKALKKWKFPAKDKSAYTAKFPLKISK